MADPIDIASMAGTWVAAFFAIVALIGIVGPFLILQQTRSDRYQALASVDVDGSDYISSGFTPWRGYSFFRKGRVPVLDEPPRPGLGSPSDFFAVTETDPRGRGNSHENSDLERDPIAQTMSSSTGWVNFASTMELYEPRLIRADKLVFYGRQSWLPVHRFRLLAFGLRGRYGDRKDKGKAWSSGNATRLRIEGHNAEDRDAAYHFTPLRGKLYGFTGILWWKVSGQHPPGPDEVYYAMHPVDDRQPSLLSDPLPLSTLFWLSLGCLPLTEDPRNRVFDLAGFRSASQEYYAVPGQNGREEFFRFQNRGDSKGYRSINTKGSAALATSASSELFVENRTDNPDDGSSKQWADAMGIDLKYTWCMNRFAKEENTKEQVAKGLWWTVADPQPVEKYYIWRSDIQTVALGILHIPLSPVGFLFDHQRTGFSHGSSGVECTVFKRASYKLTRLMSQMETTHFLSQLPKHEHKALERLWSCFPYEEATLGRPFRFGRYRTTLTYQLDTEVLRNRNTLPMVVQDIVGILTMTSHIRPQHSVGRVSNTLPSLTDDSFLDLLIECMADPSRAQTFSLGIGVDADVVSVSCDGSKILQASMIFKEVFADNTFSYLSDGTQYQNFVDFVLAALKALLRCVMFESAVDSNRLLNVVEKMTDVVNVSAESRPPPFEHDHNPYGNVPGSSSSRVLERFSPPVWERHFSSSSDTTSTPSSASSKVKSDYLSAVESQPEPGNERESNDDNESDDDSSQSDSVLLTMAPLYQSKRKLRLAKQIRDLQRQFSTIDVKIARKELKRLTQASAERAEQP